MFREQNSPEYEAKMAAEQKRWADEDAAKERSYKAFRKSGRGKDWTEISQCPFEALNGRYDETGAILVTDGNKVTVARVTERFGTPLFWKKEPEIVMRDGMRCLVGGEKDPRPDLPKWWWKWEIKDELETEEWAYGEPAGQPEVDFIPTHWRLLPEPPPTPSPAPSE